MNSTKFAPLLGSVCACTTFSSVIAVGLLLGFSVDARAEFDTVIETGPSSNRVDIFFLGDGYTAADLSAGTYSNHVQSYLNYIFADQVLTDPYHRYRNFFNVYQVNVESNESGADVPQHGITKDTALDASYRFDGVTDRLLYIDSAKAFGALDAAIVGSDKTDEVRFVTVNSAVYGGGGGSWAVYAGGNGSAREVALHESGHSFNSLADEYGGPGTFPSGGHIAAINVSTDPTGSDKWSRWLGYLDPTNSIVGAYEGARYFDNGLYRPTVDSKMRNLNRPFNAIGREKIILDIYDLVDPLDSFTSNISPLVDPLSLDVTTIDDDVISTQWFIDSFYDSAHDGLLSLDINALGLSLGDHTVQLRAYDPTGFDPINGWVRIETEKLEQFVDWNISITVPEPTSILLVVLGFVACGWQRRKR